MAIRQVDYLVTDCVSSCLPDWLYDRFYNIVNKKSCV